MYKALFIQFLLVLFAAHASAQIEVTKRDGQSFQGEVVSQTASTITFKVFSKTKGTFTEITLEKSAIARMYDIIADKDVSSTYLGISAVPPPVPQQEEGQGVPQQTMRPTRPFIMSENTYHGEIDFMLLYRHYPNIESDAGRQLDYEAGFIYRFAPIMHDDAHRTGASKNVIPTSWISTSLYLGPTYECVPNQLAFRASGVGLLSSTLALGGAALYHVTTMSMYGWKYEETDWAIGPLVDLFPSQNLCLQEHVASGDIKVDYRGSEKSYETFRYEHYLSLVSGRSFGYSH